MLLGLTSPKPLIGSKKLLDSYGSNLSSVIGRGRPPVDYQTVQTALLMGEVPHYLVDETNLHTNNGTDEMRFSETAKAMKNIITRTPTKMNNFKFD